MQNWYLNNLIEMQLLSWENSLELAKLLGRSSRVPFPFQRPCTHKLIPHGFSDLGPAILEALDIRLQLSNTLLLDLTGEHLATLVRDTDPLQLVVIFQEEGEILEWHIGLGVAAVLALQLSGILAARERKLVDFVLDAVGRVVHEDGGCVDAGRHLGPGAL